MYQVLIADDHALVRTGVRAFLKDEHDVTAIGEAVNGKDALEQLRRSAWDLLILDIQMRDVPGLDLLSRARALCAGVRVLVLSGGPEEQFALNVLQAGAHGYVSKSGSAEDLKRAVRTVLSGRTYLSEKLTLSLRHTLEFPRCSGRPLHARLSPREFEVMCRLAHGVRLSEVARELGLSVKTVSTHRSRLLEKMAFANNSDITAYALRNHLIE